MKNNPLRVTVVEPRGSGGMIHYAYQLCTALAEEGADVTLVTTYEYEMDDFPHNFSVNKLLKLWSPTESSTVNYSRNILSKAVSKLFWNIRRAQRGIRFIVEWVKLIRHLLKTKPDIVQFGKIEFPFEAFFLTILKQNGLILSQVCHEFELRESGNSFFIKIVDQMYKWVYASFAILFFHGQNNKDRFLSLFNVSPNNCHLIPHGNEQLFLTPNNSNNITAKEMRQRYGIDTSSPVVLFFGNLMPSKGIPDLIKAFALVKSQSSNPRLIIAGKPSKYISLTSLTDLANNEGVGDTTIFDTRYIPIEEVAPLMEMSSVVVYPYLNSTQSGSLQVAYTFNRPVIATNVGGLPEAVDDGKSGFLVPPGSPQDIAQAINKFIENPSLTEKMGSYAKELSETRFSWSTVAKNMMTIYSNYCK